MQTVTRCIDPCENVVDICVRKIAALQLLAYDLHMLFDIDASFGSISQPIQQVRGAESTMQAQAQRGRAQADQS